MPRPVADTRESIRREALDLFAARGVDATSLREIAERVGVTKAALYYHYASKEALLADLVSPLLTDLETLAAGVDEAPAPDAAAVRELLERYWDLCRRHRNVLRLLVTNPRVVASNGLFTSMIQWRERLDRAVAPRSAPSSRVASLVALGGLQDVVVVLDEGDLDGARGPAIDAAVRALGAADGAPAGTVRPR